MVAKSRPLAAPDNLMDGAPEERNSSQGRWGWVRSLGGGKKGGKKQQQKSTIKKKTLKATK